jgi:uncharacterized protein YfkK (UPF0435 family)
MSYDELDDKDLEELKEIHSQLQEKINNQIEEMQEA